MAFDFKKPVEKAANEVQMKNLCSEHKTLPSFRIIKSGAKYNVEWKSCCDKQQAKANKEFKSLLDKHIGQATQEYLKSSLQGILKG